ncbi:MAG TPA: hypothetical protein VLA19_09175, partial [Herpetosiphonaceae bacterium]|nr:hypothetical protein [Herpetosiphonaceae bacterium]
MPMSGDIIHGAWLPALHQFFLWGETAEPVRRKRRQPKIPPHPFQSVPQTLHERLAHLGVEPAGLAEHTLTLWLPSVDKAPLPSPELLATGAADAPEGVPELAPWKVAGLLLPPGPALDLLMALPAEDS